jgi:hypothetical protein
MIRYSSYGANNLPPPSEQNNHPDLLEEQYRELLELRERVKKAEAAAVQRKRPRFARSDCDAGPILLGAA